MKDKDFIKVSQYVKQMEPRLLTKAEITTGAQTLDFSSALSYFSSRPGYNFEDTETLEQADENLSQVLAEVYVQIKELTPYKEIIQLLETRYEFDSLKVALLDHLSSSGGQPVYPAIGEIAPKEYSEFFVHQDPFDTPLPDYLLKPAQQALKETSEGKSPVEAQRCFPHAMYKCMLDVAEEINNPFITDMVKTMIDFHNTLTVLNVKANQLDTENLQDRLIEGGKTSTSFYLSGITRGLTTIIPAVYHKEFSDAISTAIDYYEKNQDFAIFPQLFRYIQRRLADKTTLVAYGAEVPFGYILRVEDEIAQIRTILYGKTNEQPYNTLSAYLFIN